MFLRGDWVTIPSGYSAESAQMVEGDRVVGIVNDFVGGVEAGDAAIIHVVDSQAGLTIKEVLVPMGEIKFITTRESVPPQRLETYAKSWVPRGIKWGLV